MFVAKVNGWITELETCSSVAQTQPHTAFTHGIRGKWNCTYIPSLSVTNALFDCKLSVFSIITASIELNVLMYRA